MNEVRPLPIRKILLAAAALVIAPIFVYSIAFRGGWSDETEEWSWFATYMAGTSGVLVGAFGFLALIYTVRLQQKQLDDITREARYREAEIHLDRLLRVLSEIVAGTDIRKRQSSLVVAQGRDAFRNFYRRKLGGIYSILKRTSPAETDERVLVRHCFDELYRRFGSDFGHYFRTLYHAVLAVHESGLSDEWKKKQMALIFCRLSKFELALLAYNCLGSRGEVRFKPLLEQHGLLEHLDARLLLNESHAEFFAKSARLSRVDSQV